MRLMGKSAGNGTGELSAPAGHARVADDDQVGVDSVGDGHQHRRRVPNLRMFDHPYTMSFARVVADFCRGLRRHAGWSGKCGDRLAPSVSIIR